jgi:hypothetical protein
MDTTAQSSSGRRLDENRNVETVLEQLACYKLRKTQQQGEKTYVHGIVKAKANVQRINGVNVSLLQTPPSNVQVLAQSRRVVALGDNRNAALRGPSQQHLRRRLAVLRRRRRDHAVLQQRRRGLRRVHVQLKETQRPKGRVCSHRNALALHILHQPLLLQIRMVLDLQRRRADARMPQQVDDQLDAEVADAYAARQLLVNQRLHGLPRLLDGGVAELDVAGGVGPAGRVALGRVDVFQRDGEVDEEQVEVVESQIGQLLARRELDLVAVVERVPQLGDHEQLLTRDEPVFDGARKALADFLFVAVVCRID